MRFLQAQFVGWWGSPGGTPPGPSPARALVSVSLVDAATGEVTYTGSASVQLFKVDTATGVVQ